ncbi:MAG: hypothetical protein V3U52_04020 [Thermoplasmata archaeon]
MKQVDRCIEETAQTFVQKGRSWFWKEHDIQSHLYAVMLDAFKEKGAFDDPDGAFLVRREHRLWTAERQRIGRTDLAILSREAGGERHDRLTSDLIEIKHLVEDATGWTEPDDLADRD